MNIVKQLPQVARQNIRNFMRKNDIEIIYCYEQTSTKTNFVAKTQYLTIDNIKKLISIANKTNKERYVIYFSKIVNYLNGDLELFPKFYTKKINAKKYGYSAGAFLSSQHNNPKKWKYIYSLDIDPETAIQKYIDKVELIVNYLQEKFYDIEFEYFEKEYCSLYANTKFGNKYAFNQFIKTLYTYIEKPLTRNYDFVKKLIYIYEREIEDE